MWRDKVLFNIINLFIILQCVSTAEDHPAWQWQCEDSKCVKTKHDPRSSEPALSLEACKMFCNEYGLLWPKPTGNTDLGRFLSKININNIEIQIMKRGRSNDLMSAAGQRFKKLIAQAVPNGVMPKATGKAVYVYIVNANPDITDFSLDLDESYGLRVSPESKERINATIFGNTYFGVRHGLETLLQTMIYDENTNQLMMARDVIIDDKPVYPYRGFLLDTARNYYSVDSIKATIEAMAAVKLNTFHWHITDSQSFPFVSGRRPNLPKYGAYSPAKVYSPQAVREVVRFGRERGVRVLPEFDAPAHVGEGWQDTDLTVCFKVYSPQAVREVVRFGRERGVRVLPEFDAPAHVGEGWQDTDLTVCFKAEPWSSYCVEPPCGQLNPTKEELYDYLEDIYRDMAEMFETDVFHMGGDEVSERCWNSSQQIRDFMTENRWGLDRAAYLKLWNYFQTKAQDRAYKAFGKRLPLILWTSTLTDYSHVEKYLDKEDYIIQVWTTAVDPQIKGLLKKGYRLIMSNYDALYLDCGYGAWVGTGNNWCSPYIGWQKVYENSPREIAQEHSDKILGGEAALWSEQADAATLDARAWPRAAALAERLWAEPDTPWSHAEARMLHVRERLVKMGIKAESIEPEWCYQNEGYCYA